ncbi:hypothetical protein [Paenibacillus sp. A3M_27_13]|uniref:hypothetical protein n=1 Tax=Paenibacillus sp. A3M_27_13 TaxID=2962029 RepID=UPI0020B6B3B8|nr:hypothetical protein [Paenibacillus sp. A3M_27_13]MCP3747576.1 hypothetical protein [Paenibacillus sp. A3M_27_13]
MRRKGIDQSLAQFTTSTEEDPEWEYSHERDMAILGLWDKYTLSAQRLCERMAIETHQIRPSEYDPFPTQFEWLKQEETDLIIDGIWSADLHGDHCLFMNNGEHHPERHTSIEAYIYDTQVIDEGFFLKYLNTSPKANAYVPLFRKNGYAAMCGLLDKYVREGILERVPNGFKRTDR